nr:hypothetical protein [Tanacetum cinerariifolium]
MVVVEVLQTLEYRGGQLNTAPTLEDFQDSLDDEEDTRSSQEYINDLEKEYQARALLAKSKRFFKKGAQRHTKEFEAKYNKVKAKLALLSSSTSAPSSSSGKNRALMALADEERVFVSKESAKKGEWIKISMKKVHTLFEIEDNDDRKSFLDYLCIDLKYVEEQRNNLMSKHRNLVQELNTCKEQLLVLKQAKLDLLTMQHVNTKILKEDQKLRNELKKLTSITKAWLNSSNKVNQCISEQIPTQKKKILGINQLTEDTFSSGQKYPVFVKSSADNSEVSITSSNKPKLSEAKDSTLSNHDTGKMNIQSVAPLSSTREADWIISLRRGIKPRNPQHVKKNYETCGSNVYTTSDHIDIDWFRKREALQAKKAESFKASKTESSSALRSKIPTKRELFTRPSNMYKEYLAEFWYSAKTLKHSMVSFFIPTGGIYGELRVNTFRNAIGVHYLPHSREYVAPPSIDIVRPWFETIRVFDHTNKDAIILYSLANGINIDYASIFWEDIIIKVNKRHREKVVPYTRFLSLLMMHKMKEGYGDGKVTPYPTQVFSVNHWALKPNQPEEPLFTEHMLAICNVAEPLLFKAPKPSSNAKRVPQGTKPEAKPGHKKHSTSSKQPYVSSKEATKGGSSKAPTGSKTGHLKIKKESSSAIGSNSSQTSASTPVLIPRQVEEDEASRTIKLEDLVKLVSSVQPSFKDLDSPKYDPIIVVDDSDKDKEADKVHATTNVKTKDTLVPKSSSPMSF